MWLRGRCQIQLFWGAQILSRCVICIRFFFFFLVQILSCFCVGHFQADPWRFYCVILTNVCLQSLCHGDYRQMVFKRSPHRLYNCWYYMVICCDVETISQNWTFRKGVFVENIIISENKVGSFVRQLLLSFHFEKSFSAQAYHHGDVFAFQQNKAEP